MSVTQAAPQAIAVRADARLDDARALTAATAPVAGPIQANVHPQERIGRRLVMPRQDALDRGTGGLALTRRTGPINESLQRRQTPLRGGGCHDALLGRIKRAYTLMILRRGNGGSFSNIAKARWRAALSDSASRRTEMS